MMEQYVLQCDCSGTENSHQIATIDDDRHGSGRFEVESTYIPAGGLMRVTGRASDANRRGDRRSPHRLKCPGCSKEPLLIRDSTIATVLDRIPADLLEQVQSHEYDTPATRDDFLGVSAKIDAALRGQPYEGEPPRMVPQYAYRQAIPWRAFLAIVSQLPRDR